ncbi:MAG: CHAT domain-containing protein [Thermoanaerobaculia bacterium]
MRWTDRTFRFSSWPFLALLLLASPLARAEEGEILSPGPARERPIAGEEAHTYRVLVEKDPLLIVVEQQGIDLLVEARGLTGPEALTVDAPNSRWGPEVLVLSADAAGWYRVEVRPGKKSMPPGRYTIRTEPLPAAPARRTAALEAMSRAGRRPGATPEARSEALSAYREALAAWRELGESRWEADATFDVAQLEQQAGDSRAAVADYQRALALWRDLSDPHRVALLLHLLGLAHRSSGETEAARGNIEEALALWRSLGESNEEEGARSDLCLLDLTSGTLPAALVCYEELLALYRPRGNPAGEATVLNNLGGVYGLMGEPDAALEHYREALALRQALGDRAGEAQTLNNIAVIHSGLAEWQEALRVYDQARQILADLGNRSEQAKLLGNLGFTYNSLGEPQRALAFLESALKLRQETGDRRGEIINLNNLGLTWRSLGDTEKALDHHQRALGLAVALGDRRQEAISHLRLGEVHLDRGDSAAALRELDQALVPLREMGDRQNEAGILHLRGQALALAGRPQEALSLLQEVLARRQTLRDRAGEAETLHALAAVERSLGRLDDALAHAEAAVSKVEELRTGFVSPDLRAAFLATRRRAYTLLIDLLMDRHAADPGGGHDRTALAVSERARARSLIDALYSGSAGRASSAPAGLLERRRSLRRRVSAKADQQLKQSGARAEALEREIEALLAELDGVEGEIRRYDPHYAALSELRPAGVEGIVQLLDPDTVLLEYSLGEARSFLWLVDAEGLRSFVLPPQREIETLARRLHEELSTAGPGAGPQRETAEALGRILLGPVWSEAPRFHRMIVLPDAALHILPFGALLVPDPGRSWDTPGARKPLLEHQEVVYLPSAATLALQRQRLEGRPSAPKRAVVFADPVFSADDARLAGPAVSGRPSSKPMQSGAADGLLPAFERLLSSRKEAEAIASLAPAGLVWSVFGLDASRDAVLAGQLRDYRIVHFATHGIADARNPELSGLVLSLVDAAGRPREGFLGLADIYELDLAADLVVLSGCRTALGREVRGEGLMGLTRGFLYAGVPRVVASLWPVQDRTTAELMARFYRAMWTEGLSPAAALRQAQRSLRSEPRYRDPYSWAGFVLQGDWR